MACKSRLWIRLYLFLIFSFTHGFKFQHKPLKILQRTNLNLVRTLLIDNFDSYTYNIWQLLAEVNGVEPYVVHNNDFDSDWGKLLVGMPDFDNVVISPGPGNPEVMADFGMCKEAILKCDVPLLGVCLGHQGLASAYGGTISKGNEPMHGRLSRITHRYSRLFDNVCAHSKVVRYHSLVINQQKSHGNKKYRKSIVETAWAEDGTVMAIQHVTKPQYGVQFHPESIKTAIGKKIIQNFKGITLRYPGVLQKDCALGEKAYSFLFRPVTWARVKPMLNQYEASLIRNRSTLVFPPKPQKPSTVELKSLLPRMKRHVYVTTVYPPTRSSRSNNSSEVDSGGGNNSSSTQIVFEQIYGTHPAAFWLDSECPGPRKLLDEYEAARQRQIKQQQLQQEEEEKERMLLLQQSNSTSSGEDDETIDSDDNKDIEDTATKADAVVVAKVEEKVVPVNKTAHRISFMGALDTDASYAIEAVGKRQLIKRFMRNSTSHSISSSIINSNNDRSTHNATDCIQEKNEAIIVERQKKANIALNQSIFEFLRWKLAIESIADVEVHRSVWHQQQLQKQHQTDDIGTTISTVDDNSISSTAKLTSVEAATETISSVDLVSETTATEATTTITITESSQLYPPLPFNLTAAFFGYLSYEVGYDAMKILSLSSSATASSSSPLSNSKYNKTSTATLLKGCSNGGVGCYDITTSSYQSVDESDGISSINNSSSSSSTNTTTTTKIGPKRGKGWHKRNPPVWRSGPSLYAELQEELRQREAKKEARLARKGNCSSSSSKEDDDDDADYDDYSWINGTEGDDDDNDNYFDTKTKKEVMKEQHKKQSKQPLNNNNNSSNSSEDDDDNDDDDEEEVELKVDAKRADEKNIKKVDKIAAEVEEDVEVVERTKRRPPSRRKPTFEESVVIQLDAAESRETDTARRKRLLHFIKFSNSSTHTKISPILNDTSLTGITNPSSLLSFEEKKAALQARMEDLVRKKEQNSEKPSEYAIAYQRQKHPDAHARRCENKLRHKASLEALREMCMNATTLQQEEEERREQRLAEEQQKAAVAAARNEQLPPALLLYPTRYIAYDHDDDVYHIVSFVEEEEEEQVVLHSEDSNSNIINETKATKTEAMLLRAKQAGDQLAEQLYDVLRHHQQQPEQQQQQKPLQHARNNDNKEYSIKSNVATLATATEVTTTTTTLSHEEQQQESQSSLSSLQVTKPPVLLAWKSRKAYKKDIETCLDHIIRGESYEVCLTLQFKGPLLIKDRRDSSCSSNGSNMQSLDEQSSSSTSTATIPTTTTEVVANDNNITSCLTTTTASNANCNADAIQSLTYLRTYQSLRQYNPAPYACYLRYNPDPLDDSNNIIANATAAVNDDDVSCYSKQSSNSNSHSIDKNSTNSHSSVNIITTDISMKKDNIASNDDNNNTTTSINEKRIHIPGGFAICSSSPECFLKVNEHGQAMSKPIKGTAKRNIFNEDADLNIARTLSTDEKSQAENLMIVDLVRNDLGRICKTGTVAVPKLMDIETYASVHQMVSTVTGDLREDCDLVDALVATYPGGSMTGAPKLRTMKLIEQLEGRPRGVYSGAIGYIGCNGAADLNIVIRTAILANNSISIGAGGAIVSLSDADEEVEEVLLKAQSVGRALGYEVKFPEPPPPAITIAPATVVVEEEVVVEEVEEEEELEDYEYDDIVDDSADSGNVEDIDSNDDDEYNDNDDEDDY